VSTLTNGSISGTDFVSRGRRVDHRGLQVCVGIGDAALLVHLNQELTMLIQIEDKLLANVNGGGAANGAGEAFGFGAGVAVTHALSHVPGWNSQVAGQPDGFQKRHESVIGPKVTGYANGMSAGPLKDFTSGVGAGATAAPGWSFRHGL
jgi:hypothetical protein